MQFCVLIYEIIGGRKLDKQATTIHVSDTILAQLMGITLSKNASSLSVPCIVQHEFSN